MVSIKRIQRPVPFPEPCVRKNLKRIFISVSKLKLETNQFAPQQNAKKSLNQSAPFYLHPSFLSDVIAAFMNFVLWI